MTNPENGRPLTFAKIAEGHWVNRETGVAIVRGGDGILRVTEPTQYRMPKYVCSGGREMKVSRRIATMTAARFRERIGVAHTEALAENKRRDIYGAGRTTEQLNRDDARRDSERAEIGAWRNRVTDTATRTDADALRDTANHHQGSKVHAASADHGRQLRRAGLVGPRGGLTRKGSIAAERLRGAALDDAFGPA
jgi:hypothetical protein